jgi:RNA polymerase sigma factor (sigma-70 family)
LSHHTLSELWLAEIHSGRFDPDDDRQGIAARRVVWMLFDPAYARIQTRPEWFCQGSYLEFVRMATHDLDASTSDDEREGRLRHEYASLLATCELEPGLIRDAESRLPMSWDAEKRHEDAVDLVRTAIAELFSGALVPRGRVGAWLCRLIRNRIRHVWRDDSRMIRVEEEAALPSAPGRSEPFECAEMVQLTDAVRAAFADLTAAEQQVARMYLLEEYQANEIARIRKTSVKTVRNQIHSMTRKLRKNERLRMHVADR